jgi:hypothetical protein
MLQEGLVRLFGTSLHAALAYGFDLEQALQSLSLFDLAKVPALRPPFPPEVSDVRFRVDLDDVPRANVEQLRSHLSSAAANLLPRST